ncbi:MAG: hypothetical protein V1843_00720 [bacterium]
MKSKYICGMIIFFILISVAAYAEIRTYRQIKGTATNEKGEVTLLDKPGDLFEFTYDIDLTNKIIIRIKIRRLDEDSARNDATVYNITGEKDVVGSEAGAGGKALVAVQKDGSETLEMGRRFAFTMRTSPFSQVITGVYKRAWKKGHGGRSDEDD